MKLRFLLLALLASLPFAIQAQKISQLPAASALNGPEIVAMTQGGVTVGASATQIANFIGAASNDLTILGNWTFAAASGNTVTINGSSTSQPLQINTGGAMQGVAISGATGNARGVLYETSGSLRWFDAVNQTAESGSNVGSDYGIFSFSDTGVFLGNPFLIQRSTGAVTVAPPYGASPGLTVNGNGTQAALSVNGLLGVRIAQINTTNTGGGYLAYERSGVDKGFFGDSSQLDSGSIDDITIRSTNGLGFATNGANRRMTIASAGNVSIAAPTSGIALTITGVSGQLASVATQPVGLQNFTVSTLPTCNATLKGGLAYVTDATTPTYNAALTGGGAVVIPVFCNGTAWTSH